LFNTENATQQPISQVSNSDGEFGSNSNTAIARSTIPPASNNSTSHPDPALMERGDGANPALSPGESADSVHTGVSNPLVPEQPAFISDDSGTLRYLGHSSTWSFSRQVLHMAHQSPHSHSSPKGSVHVEGQAYKINLQKPTVSDSDVAGLPSIDLSLYYLQTLKFRTCPLFYLFDEAHFTSHLHRFYETPATYAQDFQAWFVHYLILMAFAKAFTASSPPSNVTSSFEMFSRALRLLPEITQLCEDPVGSTEILCCIALYLQSVDHRVAASIYVSINAKPLGLSLTAGSRLVRQQEWRIRTVFTPTCRQMLLDRSSFAEVAVSGGQFIPLNGNCPAQWALLCYYMTKT
jgi:hypothetical protein